MDDYLSKPIRPDELAAVLARFTRLDERRGGPTRRAVGGSRPVRRPAAARRRRGPRRRSTRPCSSACSDGDREAVAEIVAEYASDAPRQMAGVREALAAGDARPGPARRAHAQRLLGQRRRRGASRGRLRAGAGRRRGRRSATAAEVDAGRLDDGAGPRARRRPCAPRGCCREDPDRRGRRRLPPAAAAGADVVGLRGARDARRRGGVGGAGERRRPAARHPRLAHARPRRRGDLRAGQGQEQHAAAVPRSCSRRWTTRRASSGAWTRARTTSSASPTTRRSCAPASRSASASSTSTTACWMPSASSPSRRASTASPASSIGARCTRRWRRRSRGRVARCPRSGSG